jgi:hypothetical protein
MTQPFFQYYTRFDQVRGTFGRLPPWARFIVGIFAIPGLLLAGLSILLLGVSILALLLLTVPVYRVLKAIAPSEAVGGAMGDDVIEASVVSAETSPVTRSPVEIKILEH